MALTLAETRRYARHLALPEVGGAGQLSLLHASIEVAGEPGAEVAVETACVYLIAAGVGQVSGSGPRDRQPPGTEKRVSTRRVRIVIASRTAPHAGQDGQTGEARGVEGGGRGVEALVRGAQTSTGLVVCSFAQGGETGMQSAASRWPASEPRPLCPEKAVLLGTLVAAEALWRLLAPAGPTARRLILPDGDADPEIEVWSNR